MPHRTCPCPALLLTTTLALGACESASRSADEPTPEAPPKPAVAPAQPSDAPDPARAPSPATAPAAEPASAAPAPPEAPAARVTFPDAIELRNGHVRLAFSPKAGRIVAFGPADAPDTNLLWAAAADVYDQPTKGRDGQVYHNVGGDKIWPTVQSLWPRAYGGGQWPPEGVIDGQPWRVLRHQGNRLIVESEVSPHLGVRVRREIELAADAPEATIRNVVTRVNANAYPVHIWTVTQVPLPPAAMMGVAGDRFDRETTWMTFGKPQEVAPYLDVLGEDTEAPAVAFRSEHEGAVKVGTYGEWIAGITDEHVFLQSTDFDPAGAYPDGSNVQVYSDQGQGYMELELLSPFVHLQPGESLSNTVRWQLLPRESSSSHEEVLAQVREALSVEAAEPAMMK